MRVNVYAEELTERLEIISKEIEGKTFTGLRFYLALPSTILDAEGNPQSQTSGPFIHHKGDDDSAAVTFWGKRDLRFVMRRALELLDKHYAAQVEEEKRASQQQDGLGEIDPAFYRPTIRPLMGSRAPATEAAPTEPASSITGFDAPLGELRCARCNSWDVRREDEEEVRCCSCGWKTDYYEAYKQAHPDLFTTPASLRRPPAGETRVQEQDREIMRQREQIDYIRKALLNLSAALGK